MVQPWRDFGHEIVSAQTHEEASYALLEDGTVMTTACKVIAKDVVAMTAINCDLFFWDRYGTIRQYGQFANLPDATDIRLPQ